MVVVVVQAFSISANFAIYIVHRVNLIFLIERGKHLVSIFNGAGWGSRLN